MERFLGNISIPVRINLPFKEYYFTKLFIENTKRLIISIAPEINNEYYY